MAFDAEGLNRRAIRDALEFVAANQQGITKAAVVASSSPTRQVLERAERVRAEIADAADQAAKAGLASARAQAARRAEAQAEYVRRAVAPLGVDQLARELAWVLRSDCTLGAKLVATDIVREQAELRARREKRPAPDVAVAQRLLVQARRTIADAQDAPPENAPPPEPEAPSEGGSVTGIDDLIDAIQKEGEETRKTLREEGEKTRETIEGTAKATGKVSLLLGLGALLVSFASLYLQIQEPPPTSPRAPGQVTLESRGPAAPAPTGPPAGRQRLGPPLAIRPLEDRGPMSDPSRSR